MRISDWSSDVCSSDLDPALHRLGRHRAVTLRVRNARREEIFEFEQPARAGEIFVARHAADRRFVHPDRLGDLAQRQRAHMRDAVQKKALLLLHDRARDLDDRALALVERAHEPVGTRELLGQPRLAFRSEEHTSELQSLMRISYAVFCLKKKKTRE